ncbi:MAG: DUF3291 domain-containing protein [Actinomycetota bacterium]|nr:DUF3291 domain-containing protein [Actinomycetota bacterium]
MTFELAQVNVARLVAPLDDPVLADFVAALDPANDARRSPGTRAVASGHRQPVGVDRRGAPGGLRLRRATPSRCATASPPRHGSTQLLDCKERHE